MEGTVNKTFYRFELTDRTSGTKSHACIVSLFDKRGAMDFFMSPETFSVNEFDVNPEPIDSVNIGKEVLVVPLDNETMMTCWSSWRLTDYVYANLRDPLNGGWADGLCVTSNFNSGTYNGMFNVELAVTRFLTCADMSEHDLVSTILSSNANVWFTRARVNWALSRLYGRDQLIEIGDKIRIKPAIGSWR